MQATSYIINMHNAELNTTKKQTSRMFKTQEPEGGKSIFKSEKKRKPPPQKGANFTKTSNILFFPFTILIYFYLVKPDK